MTPQELKNSILQLAIQGKLVEQRAEEGTAAELVRDILTQRRRDAELLYVEVFIVFVLLLILPPSL